jgi:hypothetical protein
MPGWLFPLIVAIHAVTAVFWAGTTFVMARTGGAGAETMMRPQLGAATLAILTGALLFWMGHSGGFGPMETTLLIGAIAALGAAIAQGWLRRRSFARAQRIAAPLLVIALIAMVTARYWT